MRNQPIKVVFGVDGSYSQHLAVALVSLLRNNPANRFDILVVTLNMAVEDRYKIEVNRCQQMGLTVRGFHASERPIRLATCSDAAGWVIYEAHWAAMQPSVANGDATSLLEL